MGLKDTVSDREAQAIHHSPGVDAARIEDKAEKDLAH
jgi:hypothetical protein